MPDIQRLYIITDASALSQAETDAEVVDIAGTGTGSFAKGARLSDDGGDTVTHRAANVLRNGDILDLPEASQRFDAGRYEVYGCTGRFGEGEVYFWDGEEYNWVGEGDLETIALSKDGSDLDKYETEVI